MAILGAIAGVLKAHAGNMKALLKPAAGVLQVRRKGYRNPAGVHRGGTEGVFAGAVKMLQTTSDGERFVHRELWQVVVGQLDQAKDKSGSFYNHLVAMVFAFHTLEAYVNFNVEKLRPEMLVFRRGHFPSFDKKLQEVRAHSCAWKGWMLHLGRTARCGNSRSYETRSLTGDVR